MTQGAGAGAAWLSGSSGDPKEAPGLCYPCAELRGQGRMDKIRREGGSRRHTQVPGAVWGGPAPPEKGRPPGRWSMSSPAAAYTSPVSDPSCPGMSTPPQLVGPVTPARGSQGQVQGPKLPSGLPPPHWSPGGSQPFLLGQAPSLQKPLRDAGSSTLGGQPPRVPHCNLLEGMQLTWAGNATGRTCARGSVPQESVRCQPPVTTHSPMQAAKLAGTGSRPCS